MSTSSSKRVRTQGPPGARAARSPAPAAPAAAGRDPVAAPSPLSLLGSVFQASPDGIAAVGLDLRVILWNPAMERFCGAQAGQVVGRGLFEAFPSLRATEQASLELALRGVPV